MNDLIQIQPKRMKFDIYTPFEEIHYYVLDHVIDYNFIENDPMAVKITLYSDEQMPIQDQVIFIPWSVAFNWTDDSAIYNYIEQLLNITRV